MMRTIVKFALFVATLASTQRLSPLASNCRMMTIASSTSVRMQNYCLLKS